MVSLPILTHTLHTPAYSTYHSSLIIFIFHHTHLHLIATTTYHPSISKHPIPTQYHTFSTPNSILSPIQNSLLRNHPNHSTIPKFIPPPKPPKPPKTTKIFTSTQTTQSLKNPHLHPNHSTHKNPHLYPNHSAHLHLHPPTSNNRRHSQHVGHSSPMTLTP